MDRKTVESYDRTADGYEQDTADFWERLPQPPFLDAFTAMLNGRRVLDLGSGTGRDGLMFRDRGIEPICLDASAAMVNLSAQKGLRAMRGDFASPPFQDGQFDGVWAYTSLLHVPKEQFGRVLVEIHRVLKPGGIFGLGLIEGDGEEYRDTKHDGNPRWFSYYGVEEARDLLERNGFGLMYTQRTTPRTRTFLHFLARGVPDYRTAFSQGRKRG